MRCPKGLWPLGLKNKYCWTRARQSQTSITRTVPLKITPTVFSIEHGYYREIPGKVHWELTACTFANFEWGFLFRQSFEWGAKLVLITMQRTRSAWPPKTKLRMTLDCSRVAKEIVMMSGVFVQHSCW